MGGGGGMQDTALCGAWYKYVLQRVVGTCLAHADIVKRDWSVALWNHYGICNSENSEHSILITLKSTHMATTALKF